MTLQSITKVEGRPLRGALLSLALLPLLAWLLVMAGEVLFRGWQESGTWLLEHPVPVIVSTAYLSLWLAALERMFSLRVALASVSVVVLGFSLANHAKFDKLGIPVTPSDLLLSSQYLQVIRMLWRGPTPLVVLGMVLLAGLLLWRARHTLPRGGGLVSLASHKGAVLAGLGLACTAVGLVVLPDYNYKTARVRSNIVALALDKIGVINANWSPDGNTRVNGQLLSFLMNMHTAWVHPPRGYSRRMIEQGLDRGVIRLAAAAQPRGRPGGDVVVIMSEAWWDPARLRALRFSDPLLETLDTTARGNLFSPVFGGYTANTEFEFLTRLSNAYLPAGSIPYWQYVNHSLPSLVSDFAAAGYATTAIHPFDGKFWNRDHVYPRLGFAHFLSDKDFPTQPRSEPFITDRQMAGKIIDTIQGTPQKQHFVFAVSMQNHAPFDNGASRYPSEQRVEVGDPQARLTPQAADMLSTYATGVRDAVASFNSVVDYFKTTNRKGVVVMFGDHLPFLGDNYMVYRQAGFVHTTDQDAWTHAERQRMHMTPIAVWSSYPDAIALPAHPISPIFLGTEIKRAVGLGDNQIDMLLETLDAHAPMISQFYSKAANGAVTDGPLEDGNAAVAFYQAVQYDELFGADYTAEILRR